MTTSSDATIDTEVPPQPGRFTDAEELAYLFLISNAHEMRPHLASLDWLVKTTLEQWGETLPPEGRHYLLTAQADIANLWRTAREIDDFAKQQRGTTAALPETATLDDSLRHAVSILRPALDSKEILLSIDLSGIVKTLSYDTGSLYIIFANLLSNSAKFTVNGGRITLLGALATDGRSVRLIVNDQASSIPAEKREGIFDDLRPLENFLTRRPEGLGLGLAVARRVARMLGGDITLDAREDGNSFIVTLPVPEGQAPDSATGGLG